MKQKILTISIVGMLVMMCVTAFLAAGIEQKLEKDKEKSITTLDGACLVFEPSSHDFGEIFKGQNGAEFPFSLTNVGDEEAVFDLSDHNMYNEFYISGLSGTDQHLAAGESKEVKVNFAPTHGTESGARSADITATMGSVIISAHVTGIAVGRGHTKNILNHQLLFNLLGKMSLLRNILRL